MPKIVWDAKVTEVLVDNVADRDVPAPVFSSYMAKTIKSRLKAKGKRVVDRKAQKRTIRRRNAEQCLRATITFLAVVLAVHWVPASEELDAHPWQW
jgi:hypothetical protein